MKFGCPDQQSIRKLPIDGFSLPTRAVNCLRAAKIHTIGDLLDLRSSDILGWPNAGRKTLTDIRQLLAQLNLTLQGDNAPLPLMAPDKAVSKTATVLEDALCNCASTFEIERNAHMLVKLWGWNGDDPRTLESVGREFGLTRERVRQIEARALKRLKKSAVSPPLLDHAINELRRGAPDTTAAMGSRLKAAGISRSEFSPQSVKVATEHLGVDWPFEFVDIGSERALVVHGQGKVYQSMLTRLRRITSERGCLNALSLASDLDLKDEQVAGLKRLLNTAPEVEWLDHSNDWLFSTNTARNRLSNLCEKVLAIAPSIRLSELRRAVSRSRRLAICPPQRVLAAFLERRRLAHVHGDVVLADRLDLAGPAADSVEGMMLRVLDEHGPVLDRESFAEECVAVGINAITFYIYLLGSPVISALGKSIYCKVGANVPPGTVEEIIAKRRRVTRVSDHGWTSSGHLWCGTALTRQVITSGGIRLPTFVADFVQGEWRVKLPDHSFHGSVTCRDLFIWSFRKSFAVLGAEPSDLVAFEFDLKARHVLVRVGGIGLFEAMQESNGTSLLENIEEE